MCYAANYLAISVFKAQGKQWLVIYINCIHKLIKAKYLWGKSWKNTNRRKDVAITACISSLIHYAYVAGWQCELFFFYLLLYK